jgi:iron complex outermembrane receptor protein
MNDRTAGNSGVRWRVRRYLAPAFGSILGSVAMIPPLAYAQAVDEPAALEEVIVTARKREEKLQDVPDSITAIGATEIVERRIDSIDDVSDTTPNFHVLQDQDPATNIIAVRGIGTSRLLASAVAFAVDGVILPDSDAFLTDLTDVESIEVLRGPQGGLYGRNAIAGVVNVTTRRPTRELEGDVRVGYANGDTRDVFAAVSGPVASERALGRLSVRYHDTDGLIENQRTGDPLDHDERTRVAGRLILELTESLHVDLRASYLDQEGGSAPLSSFDVLGTTGGELTDELTRIEPNVNEDNAAAWKLTDAAAVIDWDTPAGTVTSITAFDDVELDYFADLDTTPLRVSTANQERDTRGWSQELRFTSRADQRFRYIVGAYYQQTDRDIHTIAGLDFCFLLPLPGCPTPPGTETAITLVEAAKTSGDFRQSAAFAQVNYDLTDTLELTAALRYDRDERKQLDELSQREDAATFSDTQPKLSLAWKPNADLLIYGTYAEGYKSGGFNPPPPPGASFELVAKQESTEAYEVGVKSSWLEQRLRANLALFYTDYTNPQMLRLDLQTGGQVAINGNKARIRGGELELTATPTAGWELHASAGYADARLTDFNGTGLFDDNHLPNAPEYTINVGTRYQHGLRPGLDALLRLDVNRIGTTYFAEDNLIYQPSYTTVDAQVGLEGERWSASVWAKNLFSEDYAVSAFARDIAPVLLVPLELDPYQIAPGALYGVELRYRF